MSDTQIRAAASQALGTFASKAALDGLALIETAGGPASPGPSGTLQVVSPVQSRDLSAM